MSKKNDKTKKPPTLVEQFAKEAEERLKSDTGIEEIAKQIEGSTYTQPEAVVVGPGSFPENAGETTNGGSNEYLPDPYLIEAASRVNLEGAPVNSHNVMRAMLDGKWSRKVVLLFCTARPIAMPVMYSVLAQMRKAPWLGFHPQQGTLIQRARNQAAQAFLKTEAEWSIWHDDDVVMPCGNPGYFYHRLRADKNKVPPKFYEMIAAKRLTSHKGKTIVGGVYFQRSHGGKSINSIGLFARTNEEVKLKAEIEGGAADKVVKVGWVGTGCLAVHRSVYEDIISNNPDMVPKNPEQPFNFFGHDIEKEGEDVAFCRLAARAGHDTYLDLAVQCKHIGQYAY